MQFALQNSEGNLVQFAYTNRGPLPWAVVRTNQITLESDGRTVTYTRQFRSADGTLSDGITQQIELPTPHDLARLIHWGCCGWAAHPSQIPSLLEKTTAFLKEHHGQN